MLKTKIEQQWYRTSPGWLRCLAPLEWLFRLVARRRRQRYLQRLACQSSAEHPSGICDFGLTGQKPIVVVIGNLTVGGTGKTPVIIALSKRLIASHLRVGVVSRGYGRSTQGTYSVTSDHSAADVGDEPLEIAAATGCPVVVSERRVDALRQLCDEHEVDVVLSDDGLQHYALARDIEVVVVNNFQGFGNLRCLPVGPLREPLNRLQSVDYTLMNTAEGLADHASLASMRALPVQPVHFLFAVKPLCWVNVCTGETRALVPFKQEHLRAYAGIGQPRKFFDLLRAMNIHADCHAKVDHAQYSAADFDHAGVDVYLMTAKDAVKCADLAPNNSWYLKVEADIEAGFYSQLLQKIHRLIDDKSILPD